MSILVLLPVILLLLTALAIAVIRQVRPGYGYTWMLGTGLALVVWVCCWFCTGKTCRHFLCWHGVPAAAFWRR